MVDFFKKYLRVICLTTAIFLSVFLITCVIMLVSNYDSGLYQQAVATADHYSEKTEDLMNAELQGLVDEVVDIADGMPKSADDFGAYLKEVTDNYSGYIPFVYVVGENLGQTVENEVYGREYAFTSAKEQSAIEALVSAGDVGTTEVLSDSVTSGKGFAVYAPVYENSNCDGIVAFVYLRELEFRMKEKYDPTAVEPAPVCVVMCTTDGTIFSTLYCENFSYFSNGGDLFTCMRSMTDKEIVDQLKSGMLSDGFAGEITVDNSQYVLCVHKTDINGNNVYLASIYNSHDVNSEGHQLMSSVSAIVVAVIVISLSVSGYLVITRFSAVKKATDADNYDAEFDCPNGNKFLAEADGLIGRHSGTKFAVIHCEIVHYNYIYETYGSAVARSVVKYLVGILASSVREEEFYCHVHDNIFALIFHFRDFDEVKSRINVISGTAYNCPDLISRKSFLKLSFGVYSTDLDPTIGAQKMLDRAEIATKTATATQVDNIRIYDQQTHEKFLHEAMIESKMATSLKSGEFKVFYQPKYNIDRNRPDGAEALVRWYDPEKNRFRTPAEFLPIFEANGFITELDKYVFTEVCKFVNESVSLGYRSIPISVNVSRATSLRDDFTDFYIQMKRKYGLPDKFITIEFTEAFAYENPEMFTRIVTKLHSNGIYTSIDDFGAAYSSYNIIKEMPVDEIKLGRMFIRPGVSAERDDILLKSVISMARGVHIKVTQQGVETVDDLQRLVNFGCDVVQGYIYSKPMPATDFVAFVKEGGTMSIIRQNNQ